MLADCSWGRKGRVGAPGARALWFQRGGLWQDGSRISAQARARARRLGVWPSPQSIGPMKSVQTPSRYSVRAAIAASLCDGGAALGRTAIQLGMSPRSLQRHLAAMGTSYTDMVAEVRFDTACHLLLQSDESISEIALRLGYAGTSSFSRVFMRWTKIQPVTYRRQRAVQGIDKSRPEKGPHAVSRDKPLRLARMPSTPHGNSIGSPPKGKR
mgnify:CR=1 FL=1